MPLIPVSPPQLSFEQRRGTVDRQAAIQGAVFRVSYFMEVSGDGEATVDVNFPVAFSEYPSCGMGGALAPGQVLVATNFPWCSVMVAAWKTETKNGHTYYVGATLALVCGGPTNQIVICHFHVEGKALQNPV